MQQKQEEFVTVPVDKPVVAIFKNEKTVQKSNQSPIDVTISQKPFINQPIQNKASQPINDIAKNNKRVQLEETPRKVFIEEPKENKELNPIPKDKINQRSEEHLKQETIQESAINQSTSSFIDKTRKGVLSYKTLYDKTPKEEIRDCMATPCT